MTEFELEFSLLLLTRKQMTLSTQASHGATITSGRSNGPKHCCRFLWILARVLKRAFRQDITVPETIWRINHPGVSADYWRAVHQEREEQERT